MWSSPTLSPGGFPRFFVEHSNKSGSAPRNAMLKNGAPDALAEGAGQEPGRALVLLAIEA